MLYILLWFGNVLWHFWVSAARPSPQLRSVTKLSNSQFLTISSNLCSTIIIHLSNSIYRQKEFVHEGGQGGDNDWITFKEITMVCYSSWGQLTSELGIFEHWQFTNMEIQKPFIHRQTYSMTGMELSHGRAWARDWLRAKFPKLVKDFSIVIKDQSICASRWVFRIDWSCYMHLGKWQMSDIIAWDAESANISWIQNHMGRGADAMGQCWRDPQRDRSTHGTLPLARPSSWLYHDHHSDKDQPMIKDSAHMVPTRPMIWQYAKWTNLCEAIRTRSLYRMSWVWSSSSPW